MEGINHYSHSWQALLKGLVPEHVKYALLTHLRIREANGKSSKNEELLFVVSLCAQQTCNAPKGPGREICLNIVSEIISSALDF